MTTRLGTAVVELEYDDKKLDSGITSTKEKVNGLSSTLSSVGKVAGGFLAAGAVVQGIDTFKSALSSSIGLASDLQESQSKVNVVFGDSAKVINDFASSGPKALGMSKAAAMEATGTFGAFLTAMGQTPEKAAELSTSMVSLARDMGSFNNASPEEVLLALRAGLSGEAEPLKRFGVALSEAAVQQEALTLGLGKGGKELTEQEKIMARYSIIMKQTATAQGDFERTSGGLANQQKILKAQIEDIKTSVGSALLPVMTAFTSFLVSTGIPAVEKFGQIIGPVLKDAFESISNVIRTAIGIWKFALEDGTDTFEGSTGTMRTLFKAWMDVALFIQEDLVPALRKVWETIEETWPKIEPLVTKIFDLMVKNVIKQIEGMIQTIEGVVKVVTGVVELIDALIHGEWSDAWDAFQKIVEGVVDIIEGTFKRMFGILPELALKGVTELGDIIYNELMKTDERAASAMQSIIDSIIRVLEKLPGQMARIGERAANSFLESISVAGVSAADVTGAIGSAGRWITGRQRGGPVFPGVPTIVGEQGAELYVPSRAGWIYSHEQSKGMLSGNTYIIDNLVLPGVKSAQDMLAELQEIQARELRLSKVGAR